ncbi:hypothetical protein Droror1_Dr00024909 [Drosera rotundifolia]
MEHKSCSPQVEVAVTALRKRLQNYCGRNSDLAQDLRTQNTISSLRARILAFDLERRMRYESCTADILTEEEAKDFRSDIVDTERYGIAQGTSFLCFLCYRVSIQCELTFVVRLDLRKFGRLTRCETWKELDGLRCLFFVDYSMLFWSGGDWALAVVNQAIKLDPSVVRAYLLRAFPFNFLKNWWSLYSAQVDMDGCLQARQLLAKKLRSLEKEAYKLAGMTFSSYMPTDIANVLYERLKLPVPEGHNKGKQHASTDKHCLDLLRDEHPIVPIIKSIGLEISCSLCGKLLR